MNKFVQFEKNQESKPETNKRIEEIKEECKSSSSTFSFKDLKNEINQNKKKENEKDETEEESEGETEDEEEYENDYIPEDKIGNADIIEFELIPYIFNEQYDDSKDYCKCPRFSRYSFIDLTTYNILNENSIKEMTSKLKDCLKINHELTSIDEYPKLVFNGSYYVLKCRINVDCDDLEYFADSTKMVFVNKYFERYMLKFRNFKNYTINKKYVYNFNYIKEYINIYIRTLFGYGAHNINYSCNLQKEISNALKRNSIDPFTYFKNMFQIKKSTMNYNSKTYTNIVKVGFVFNGDIEIIDEIYYLK